MTNCNNIYLKTGFERSDLQLLRVATEQEIAFLQVLKKEAFSLKRFENKLLAPRKEEEVAA